MTQREKLIELIHEFGFSGYEMNDLADYLIASGVVVLPCRCRECEYAMTSKRFEKEKVTCLYMMYPHDKNCFCSYGERKGGE